MIRVTSHALDRFIERVRPITREAALAEIMSHRSALECADSLGGCTVKLSDGTRLIVKDGSVITVLGAECRFNHPRKAA